MKTPTGRCRKSPDTCPIRRRARWIRIRRPVDRTGAPPASRDRTANPTIFEPSVDRQWRDLRPKIEGEEQPAAYADLARILAGARP